MRARLQATSALPTATSPRIAGSTIAIAIATRAMTPRNTQRHPTVSLTVPAIAGPTRAGITQAAANPPNIFA